MFNKLGLMAKFSQVFYESVAKKCHQIDSLLCVEESSVLLVVSNFTCRLTKGVDNQPKAIDWLELWNAVQNQVCE